MMVALRADMLRLDAVTAVVKRSMYPLKHKLCSLPVLQPCGQWAIGCRVVLDSQRTWKGTVSHAFQVLVLSPGTGTTDALECF